MARSQATSPIWLAGGLRGAVGAAAAVSSVMSLIGSALHQGDFGRVAGPRASEAKQRQCAHHRHLSTSAMRALYQFMKKLIDRLMVR